MGFLKNVLRLFTDEDRDAPEVDGPSAKDLKVPTPAGQEIISQASDDQVDRQPPSEGNDS
jgi:hypothetical protein